MPCITGGSSSVANNPETGKNMLAGGLIGSVSTGLFVSWVATQFVPIAGEAADIAAGYRVYRTVTVHILELAQRVIRFEQLNLQAQCLRRWIREER